MLGAKNPGAKSMLRLQHPGSSAPEGIRVRLNMASERAATIAPLARL